LGEPGGSAVDGRQGILLAAAHQFARTPYHKVSLDDILAQAKVTKGAMYFHFRSKQALALAIVEHQRCVLTDAVRALFARKLSGLETLVEVAFLVAVQDTRQDLMRAALNLLESIGRSSGLQANLVGEWVKHFAIFVQRGIAEGDVIDGTDPEDVSRQLVSLYLGMRQTSSLDDPQQYLGDLQKVWTLAMPGFVNPDRIDYFGQFIGRRKAIAVKSMPVHAQRAVE
jgi:TetR/AcrR family transcriptional regulator, transcriptional repressor for nem operon